MVDSKDIILAEEDISAEDARATGPHDGPGPDLIIPAGVGSIDKQSILMVIDPDDQILETREKDNKKEVAGVCVNTGGCD